ERTDAADVTHLAEILSAEDVQLYYQLALTGQRELGLAPDARTGFEMTLLRMLAFRPATADAEPHAPSGQARAPAPADRPAPSAPQAAPKPPSMPSRATPPEPARPAPPMPAAQPPSSPAAPPPSAPPPAAVQAPSPGPTGTPDL